MKFSMASGKALGEITHMKSQDIGSPAHCWFALQTRSRHEKVVRDQLQERGIEQLLPVVRRLSQWKDRKKAIQWPLFPGYCFAKFSSQDRLRVLDIPGVVSIVGRNQRPEPIPDNEMEAIRNVVSSRREYEPHPYLCEGEPVVVVRGPFQGLKGHLVRKATHCRLVIAVHLIQQATSVEIDAADVSPIQANSWV